MNPNINDGHDRIQETKERLSTGARQAADRVADATADAADTMAAKGQQLKREIDERWLESIRDYVQDHPIASVSMALAGGFVLSRIFRSHD